MRAYALNGKMTFDQGVYEAGKARPLNADEITEDHASSWLVRADGPRPPSRGLTLPDADADGGYSWCKAPRLGGLVAETGALARQLVDGHSAHRERCRQGRKRRAKPRHRANDRSRPAGSLYERWIFAIRPGDPFCFHAPMPDDARGEGLIEAARGALGHWLEVRKGRILNYQIVAPTTWSFSPRDAQGKPGACEQALVGAPTKR